MLIAAYPQHQPQRIAGARGILVPRRRADDDLAGRSDPARSRCAAIASGGAAPSLAVLVNLVLVVWFTAELFNGPLLGLAERIVTVDESLWPLAVDPERHRGPGRRGADQRNWKQRSGAGETGEYPGNLLRREPECAVADRQLQSLHARIGGDDWLW